MDRFVLHSEYKPTGDQPQAIESIVNGIKSGKKGADAARSYRLRQNIYHGKRDRKGAASHACAGA